jgi:hypothetical protein
MGPVTMCFPRQQRMSILFSRRLSNLLEGLLLVVLGYHLSLSLLPHVSPTATLKLGARVHRDVKKNVFYNKDMPPCPGLTRAAGGETGSMR